MAYTIVGLGNPGEEYKNTRHNTGQIILDHILDADKDSDWESSKVYQGLIRKDEIVKEKILAIKPQTFMNKSGASLKSIEWNPKKAEKLIVIHDDLDIGLGSFRISFNRSSGGHRGVESIIRTVKTEGFIRIRVGISPVTPTGKIRKPVGADKVERHILGEFKPTDLKELRTVGKHVHEALELILKGELSRAMSEWNGR